MLSRCFFCCCCCYHLLLTAVVYVHRFWGCCFLPFVQPDPETPSHNLVIFRRMVTRTELRKTFLQFSGSDKSLNRRELMRVLAHMNLPTSRRYADALLSSVDDDGSGELDEEEFISIFLPHGAEDDASIDREREEAEEVFELFCKGKEFLYTRDLKQALGSLGVVCSGKQAKRLLHSADNDGSGTLDLEEFFALYKHIMQDQNQNHTAGAQAASTASASMFDSASTYASQKHELSKAVFIGINYVGQSSELKGCVNDVRLMRNTIEKVLKFPINQSKVLVEDSNFTGFTGKPTKQNIAEAMKWLAAGAKAGDTLFFHYSGHGGSVTERVKGSEASGKDQCIFPVDYNAAGIIIDDDIFDALVKPLPPGVRLTAVFDCCHSGSIMDLPFTARADNAGVKETTSSTLISGSIIMFAGCRDDQTSADAYQGEGVWGGALTYALSTALSEHPTSQAVTVTDLLLRMRKALDGRYTQVPQMSSSHPFSKDGNFTFFGAAVEEL